MSTPPLELDAEDVTLRRHARARRVLLKVLPPGRIEVVAPPRFDSRQLPELLQAHRPWLERNLARLRAAHAGLDLSPPRRIALPAIGREWALDYQPGARRALCRERGADALQVQHTAVHDWLPPLRRWLMRTAKATLVPQLRALSGELGLPFHSATIRAQKSRWGSCSARGAINLNYRLLFLQPELVRYLMVHELCHTRHLNHSPRYWVLVAEHEPDYRRLDRQLRRVHEQLPPWSRPELRVVLG